MTTGEKLFFASLGATGLAVLCMCGVLLWKAIEQGAPEPERPCPTEHVKTRPILVCSGQSTLKLICREKTETYCEVKP